MRIFPGLLTAACLVATPLAADEITDTLNSALAAYEAGDIQYALDEIDIARQQLLGRKTGALSAFLPPAPEGWTREIDEEAAPGLAMIGGGVGAEASYAGEGKRFAIKLMADNPMVASLAGVINNAAMMGLTVERVNRQKFAIQDGEIMGLVANRILVQVSGADTETMLATLEKMDFKAMQDFGQ
ncbi:hypothetical protein [Marinovum algicola]|uniref:hypothetical protein n=1 Tax=Marinovum algicola TaxID=42444 RepID=UPI0024BB3496|nr:hypothetical protein [Marinovum algicola]